MSWKQATKRASASFDEDVDVPWFGRQRVRFRPAHPKLRLRRLSRTLKRRTNRRIHQVWQLDIEGRFTRSAVKRARAELDRREKLALEYMEHAMPLLNGLVKVFGEKDEHAAAVAMDIITDGVLTARRYGVNDYRFTVLFRKQAEATARAEHAMAWSRWQAQTPEERLKWTGFWAGSSERA